MIRLLYFNCFLRCYYLSQPSDIKHHYFLLVCFSSANHWRPKKNFDIHIRNKDILTKVSIEQNDLLLVLKFIVFCIFDNGHLKLFISDSTFRINGGAFNKKIFLKLIWCIIFFIFQDQSENLLNHGKHN